MKICTRCLEEKTEEEFGNNKRSNDGLNHWCKKCFNIYDKQYHEIRKITTQQYRKKYREDNKEHRKMLKKKWEAEHPDYHKEYRKNRKHIDALYNFICQSKKIINKSLKSNGWSKDSTVQELLGCSYEDFMQYLGPKPNGNVHRDHICPLSQAQNQEEAEKLQHYTNFRWLSADDNLKKSDNKTPEAEEMCRKLLGRDWIE